MLKLGTAEANTYNMHLPLLFLVSKIQWLQETLKTGFARQWVYLPWSSGIHLQVCTLAYKTEFHAFKTPPTTTSAVTRIGGFHPAPLSGHKHAHTAKTEWLF